jgi:hypothetical protein
MSTESATAVLNDPQFGLTAILRPYTGFDSQVPGLVGAYQGTNGNGTPIMFTEGGVPFDVLAGSPGYSKRLLKGLSVPFGARVSIWFPQVLVNNLNYDWHILWRQRNVFDYRAARLAFHYPKQGLGVPDTTVGDQPPERVIIPAALHTILINNTDYSSKAVGQTRIQGEVFRSTDFGGIGQPLAPQVPGIVAPDPMAIIQQGLLPAPTGYGPLYQTLELQALGDEMLIGATKTVNPLAVGVSANWDFTDISNDLYFSFLFGTAPPNAFGLTGGPFPDIGVYVNVGVAT